MVVAPPTPDFAPEDLGRGFESLDGLVGVEVLALR